ncbi:guanine nucleotide-binding protein subunit alpha-11-like [Stomoxys calcitrans]|uniref:Uncharacterized protein n=1 Tax=Stomoxys calcitrans TaxID=35570 RepID=A0A1I8NLK6_STOCA|nr:guanine nucleotide-binding protein subunit alpha-11-like [Stomoxys calcitrans]
MDCIRACFLTDEEIKEWDRNKEVEKNLLKWQRETSSEIKVLLLGTGESGKSTFIRQMRIIYDEGYSEEERDGYKVLILGTILKSMEALVKAMDNLQISYEHKYNLRNAQLITNVKIDDFLNATDMYASALKDLWNDAGVQHCFQRRREYHIADSIKYYVSHTDRIADANYVPSNDDILHMRAPTTGLVEYKIKIRNTVFRMIDVGGQRSERRKWIHCFDRVQLIIFLVAISEYDQILEETMDQNRLLESRSVFTTLCNNEWFCDTPFLVFFNKIDLLEEKIMYSDLAVFFPEYQGPKQDHMKAREFLRDMFLQLTTRRKFYKHFTCATDTNQIKTILEVVRNTVIKRLLDQQDCY